MQKIRSSLTFLLATLFCLSCTTVNLFAESTFDDILPDTWFHDAVDWAVETGITVGTSEHHFSPNKVCTRGEIMTFLWRANGSPVLDGVDNPFSDVSEDRFFYHAVLWAVHENLTAGTTADTFSPDSPCTRGQIITFLWRLTNAPRLDVTKSSFSDILPRSFYEQAVYWAIQHGITNGTSAQSFSPNQDCTRAQAVCFLYRRFTGNDHQTNENIHLYKLTQTSPASCTAPLTYQYHCILCDLNITETEGAPVHNYRQSGSVPATCTSAETITYRCTLCGNSYSATGASARGHSFRLNQVTTTQYPNPSNPRHIGTGTCSVCHATVSFDTVVECHTSQTAEEEELIRLINQSRAAVGVSPLAFAIEFYDCSKWRAFEIVQLFEHTRPNGKKFHTILDELEVPFVSGIAENIQYATIPDWTAQNIHKEFMNSEGHKNNLLNPKWELCTVYIFKICNTTFCVEHFYRTK